MASIIQGTANGDLELVAGTGRSIVFTTDAEGSIDLSVIATQGFVTSQISNIIDSAPGALDTINELAAALGDDENFSTTITNALTDKANSADVYTSTEVDDALALKADASTTYTTTQVDDALDLKADASSVYTTTEIDDALALKANSADVYTSTEVDDGFQAKFVTAPASSAGAEGDLEGQIAIDSNHIYYCTADYDGLSDIWARVALTLETW